MPMGVYPRHKRGRLRVPRHAVIQPLDKPYRFIVLTQGQVAIVDAADYEWLNQWNWHARWCPDTKTFYAMRTENSGYKIEMGRLILDCFGQAEQHPDHRNGDTLDNRRQNLRKATHSQNQCNKKLQRNNKSGFVGVSWNRIRQKYAAYVIYNGQQRHLGYFISKEEAAHVRDGAAKELHGEFAVLNFPELNSDGRNN